MIKNTTSGGAQKPLVLMGNLIIFALIFAMLRGNYLFSLVCVFAVIVCLLTFDKIGIISKVYTLYIAHKKFAFITAVLCALAIPFLLARHQYESHIAVMALIYAMVCLGLNFQMGSTNMVNFAPAAFMGIGAYSMAVVTVKWHASPWLGMLLGIALCAVAGLLIGLPTLRTKGYYLSLVTMALQLALTQLVKNISYLGGANGLTGVKPLDFAGLSLFKPYTIWGVKLVPHFFFLILCIIILILLLYIAMRIGLSRYGLSMNSIAQDEIAAGCFGVNVSQRKLFSFVIGGIFCGIGGALYASLTAFVGPNDFTFARSLVFICMVILGGMDNPMGVATGAFLLTVMTEKLRQFSDYAQLIYALVLAIVLIVRPAGLVPKRVRFYHELFKKDLPQTSPPPDIPEKISLEKQLG
jgi:branched-chain amino acid transport system permease protein